MLDNKTHPSTIGLTEKLKTNLLSPLAKLFRFSRSKNDSPIITKALLKLFSKSYVEKMSLAHPQERLIEVIARDRQIDQESLLHKVAELLNLESALKVPPISQELIESLTSEPQRFQKLGVVPVDSNPKHFLVCSNPENINLKKFLDQGTIVKLALGATVETAWQQYNCSNKENPGNNQVSTSDSPQTQEESLILDSQLIQEVIHQLAKDCFSMGASEVFLGHPEKNLFEFNVGQNRYRGKIHNTVVQQAIKLISNKSQLDYHLEDLSFSLKICEIDGVSKPMLKLSSNRLQKDDLYKSPDFDETIERTNRSVLLLDDDPRFLKVLKNIMEGKGWTVQSTCSGAEAIELATDPATRPDLIISDIRMPEVDGEEVLAKLKATLPKLPVIMLTGENDRMLEARLALLGADAFARKQDDPAILLSWCQAIVNKSFLEGNSSLH